MKVISKFSLPIISTIKTTPIPIIFRLLLLPVSLVWFLYVGIKNILYNYGILKSKKFNSFIISIGNMRVGGTGKTPLIDFLIKELSQTYSTAIVSKGYQRKSKKTIIANSKNIHSIEEIGDENYLLLERNKNIDIVISSKKIDGVEILDNIGKDIVILDDAYHCRDIVFSKNILLTDYKNMFYDDTLMPTGNLREHKSAYKRADIILVTKCKLDISDSDSIKIIKKIKPLKNQKVFFSGIMYGELKHILNNTVLYITNTKKQDIIALHGIGQGDYFIDYLSKKFNMVDNLSFCDHHNYSEKDVKYILQKTNKNKNCIVITTEKDSYKLRKFNYILKNVDIYFIPINIKILFNDKENFLSEVVSKNRDN